MNIFAGKRGELSYLTKAILALLVLVILAFIFRDQIGKAFGFIDTVGNESAGGLSGDKCEVFGTQRQCADSCSDLRQGSIRYVRVPGSNFDDCTQGQVCCDVR
ncbi:hypothetical protein GF342_05030 [Candidatus Woesearchaeota archaeon]|nr:hypothetical protein [Candidatus Woesearchaeota archaeon]